MCVCIYTLLCIKLVVINSSGKRGAIGHQNTFWVVCSYEVRTREEKGEWWPYSPFFPLLYERSYTTIHVLRMVSKKYLWWSSRAKMSCWWYFAGELAALLQGAQVDQQQEHDDDGEEEEGQDEMKVFKTFNPRQYKHNPEVISSPIFLRIPVKRQKQNLNGFFRMCTNFNSFPLKMKF